MFGSAMTSRALVLRCAPQRLNLTGAADADKIILTWQTLWVFNASVTAGKAQTMARTRMLFCSGAAVLAVLAAAAFPACAEDLNDYPTSARADYVFGCMKANGETQALLQKCSCSIDVIASIIPYERYVTAETILSMSQVTGPVGSEFRATEPAKLALQEFRRAQAEAEIRCF
jgi:hypothetical protein